MDIFTVSQYTALIKGTLEQERALRNCFVTGIVSNFKRHSNGCYYFSLKDENASIDVTIFQNVLKGQAYAGELDNGLMITLRGSLNFYEKMGRLNLIGYDVIVGNKSSFQIAYELLKKELAALGYFDAFHKKNLPLKPSCIGLGTSESGAVLHDILHIAKKRNPHVRFKLFSVPVQGEIAPPYIAKGIELADKDEDVEVIIVGRGGGSLEDLWCFNDRKVVEAVYNAKTPVISAVGHETDYSLCDFAADIRAATPSHAAELAVYPLLNLIEELAIKHDYLHEKIREELDKKRIELRNLFDRKLALPVLKFIHREKTDITKKEQMLLQNLQASLSQKQRYFALLVQKLELSNPLALLAKGYVKAEHKGNPIQSISTISLGDRIRLMAEDGLIEADVKELIYHGKQIKKL